MRNLAMAALVMGVAVTLWGCGAGAAKKAGSTDGKTSAGRFCLRVNCGAIKDYADAEGKTWVADQEFQAGAKWGAVGGRTVLRSLATIPGTKAPGVYLSERYGMSAYKFLVPNGTYTIALHFAETYEGIAKAGDRVFTVKLQGKPVLKDYDPFQVGGGIGKPVVARFQGIRVTDGTIEIGFVEGIQNPEINGIEIIGE